MTEIINIMASKGVEIVPAIDESNDNSLIGVVN
jgi:hypothetical protein